MPPPPHSPNGPANPYGAPPPAPYGPPSAPHHGTAHPQPYGPQPPPGPYGPQPAPHHGAPYPPPYGWGPPPPKKRRVGLVLGIVGGAAGVLVAIVVALAVVGAAADRDFPEARYVLSVPGTLLNDRYELAEDLSGTQGQKILDEADGAWDARTDGAAVGRYSLGGDETTGTLVVSGMYGRFKHTDAARRNMMEGAARGEGATTAVPPRDFRPAGAGGPTVSCEVITQMQAGTRMTVPVCGWADDNTGATVAVVSVDTVNRDPTEIDLAQAADDTLRIRTEMRRAIA
ncbi:MULTISPECIES: hypothetical protein [unclassified Streptomyces]|uniref:hypothetical protein n=1 Tax=unclassified Streptomyces TaxID=2593676 RepID=UPI001F04E45A|nr:MULTISPECIES: hypothetical protein [unclassified Streptomyces]